MIDTFGWCVERVNSIHENKGVAIIISFLQQSNLRKSTTTKGI